MQVMNSRSFWLYTGVAAVLSLFSYKIVGCTTSLGHGPVNPNYAEFVRQHEVYEKWQQQRGEWDDQNAMIKEQRKFEAVIAGIVPAEQALPRGSVREIALSIRTLASTSTDAKVKAEALISLFLTPERTLRSTRWLQCRDQGLDSNSPKVDCKFVHELNVLNSTMRLTQLLRGDQTGPIQIPEIPAHLKNEPINPSVVEEYLDESAGGVSWSRWLVFSAFFAVFFTGLGLILHHDDEKWSHPLETWPSFVAGWFVKLLMVPGFIVVHGIYLLLLDVRPFMQWLRQHFSKRTFKDEYEAFEVQLAEINERASRVGDPAFLDRIAKLQRRVALAQNKEHIVKLQGSLIDIERYLDSMDELEKEIGVAS